MTLDKITLNVKNVSIGVAGGYQHSSHVAVSIEGIDTDELLEVVGKETLLLLIPISDVIDFLGVDKVLNEIGVDNAIMHFKITVAE